MEDEPQIRKCNPDDILCQMQALNTLEGMQTFIKSDKFRAKFPDAAEMEEVIAERIIEQELKLKETFEKCGLPVPEEESNNES